MHISQSCQSGFIFVSGKNIWISDFCQKYLFGAKFGAKISGKNIWISVFLPKISVLGKFWGKISGKGKTCLNYKF